MKYIIDLPDAYISESALLGDILSIPICLESGKCYEIPTGIKLEPYIEPDMDEIRQMAHEEVWEFARRIICPSDCCEDSISAHTKEIFNKEGWETRGIFNDLSYQEAKAKYDAWKKSKEEIHVGDEVQYSLGNYEYTFIVFGKENDTLYGIRSDEVDMGDVYNGWDFCDRRERTLKKTGRHFDEVEKLLKKMKED